MKKKLRIDTVLTDFDDAPLMHNGVPLTLRKALLDYIHAAHAMGVSGSEEMSLYFIGKKIGKTPVDGVLSLEIQDFNLLQRLSDTGKVMIPNQPPQAIFRLVIAQQIRVLLQEAEATKGD